MQARKIANSRPHVRRAVALGWLVGAYLLPSFANAATCSLNVSPLNFGVYDALSMAPADSSTDILVSCTRTVTSGAETVAYTLAVSSGAGNFSARNMLRGTAVLVYNLHTGASRSAANVWGDGTGGSSTVTGSLLPLDAANPTRTANHALYGRIPARQDVAVGAYNANVVVTVTF